MTSSARSSDRFIPYYIVAFFIFLTSLLTLFVWLAIRNYPGEVTNDAYKKGLQYTSTIEKSEAQEKLGWNSDIHFTMHGLEVTALFTLIDKDKHPIKNAQTNAWFIRPTHAGQDQKIALTSDGKGSYSGKTTLAWPGAWEVHISSTYNGHNYQRVKNINLQ